MTILSLRPSEIRFSQDSIAYYFGYGRFAGILIGQTLDDLLQGKCKVNDIPTITVSSRDGLWYSGDNRRLWVFRKCEELGIIDRVPAEEGYINSSKFTTDNRGVSIRVRGNPGGRFWTQRNRKDLVIKEHETSNTVEPSATVANTTSNNGLVAQLSWQEEEKLSNNKLSDSSEDLTDIAYDSDQSVKLEPLQSWDGPEETSSCLQSSLSYEGQDNPTFVGAGNDQQCMPGIEDQGCLNEITFQLTLNRLVHSDNEYVTVDLPTLDGGLTAHDEPVVIDLQNTKPSVVDTNHLTVSRPKDAAEVELRHKVRVPSLTAISENINNCFLKYTRVWLTFIITWNILCLVFWMLRLRM